MAGPGRSESDPLVTHKQYPQQDSAIRRGRRTEVLPAPTRIGLHTPNAPAGSLARRVRWERHPLVPLEATRFLEVPERKVYPGLGPRRRRHFGQYVIQVILDGPFRDIEVAGNRGVGLAPSHQCQHFDLASSETRGVSSANIS